MILVETYRLLIDCCILLKTNADEVTLTFYEVGIGTCGISENIILIIENGKEKLINFICSQTNPHTGKAQKQSSHFVYT